MVPKVVGNYRVVEISRPDEPYRRLELTALDDTTFTRQCYIDRAFPLMYAQGYEPLTAHLNAFANYLDKERACQ